MIVFRRRSLVESRVSLSGTVFCVLGFCIFSGCATETPSAPETVAAAPEEEEASPPALPAADGQVELLVAQESGEIAHVPGTFQEAIQTKDKIVVVDFWATWCGPCKMLSPELEKIAAENEDVLIVKVDVDEAPDVAVQFEASAIPDIRIFRDGEMVEKIIGYRTAEQLLEAIRGS